MQKLILVIVMVLALIVPGMVQAVDSQKSLIEKINSLTYSKDNFRVSNDFKKGVLTNTTVFGEAQQFSSIMSVRVLDIDENRIEVQGSELMLHSLGDRKVFKELANGGERHYSDYRLTANSESDAKEMKSLVAQLIKQNKKPTAKAK